MVKNLNFSQKFRQPFKNLSKIEIFVKHLNAVKNCGIVGILRFFKHFTKITKGL